MSLSSSEYKKLTALLKRTPNQLEQQIFTALWSEHCSYKSTQIWLQQLHSKGARVIQGPGENAGAVDIGDGEALVFKAESHNHPSQLDPYNGAATGVGGILRDVFVMGAKPIAIMNMLFFGKPHKSKMQYLMEQVTAGIGAYGNSFGVPNLGGKTIFDECYEQNILVNVFAAGIAKHSELIYTKARRDNFDLFYLGAKTGRDGLGGAVLASCSFTNQASAPHNSQIANPFLGRCLLEAFQEMHAAKYIQAASDLGAAGLVGAASELAAKNGKGIDLWLDQVPALEENMSARELLLAETQERILLILPEHYATQAQAIAEKWGLAFNKIGTSSAKPDLCLYSKQQQIAQVPIEALTRHRPIYKLPAQAPAAAQSKSTLPPSSDFTQDIFAILSHVNKASKHMFYEQFDSYVQGSTILHPGRDAALIKLANSDKAVGFSTHSAPRYCASNPKRGAIQAMAQCWRDLNAIGCEPLAITNNLNFADPNQPEIMAQFIATIQGLNKAAKQLRLPIVSGNVSLYNQTGDSAIKPSPTIVAVGLAKNWQQTIALRSVNQGDQIFLLGQDGRHLDCSLYQAIHNSEARSNPPKTHLKLERTYGHFIRKLITSGTVNACYGLGSGGLAAALAKLTIQHNIGLCLNLPLDKDPTLLLFAEDQARYLISVSKKNGTRIMQQARAMKLNLHALGHAKGDKFNIAKICNIAIKELQQAYYNSVKV